jgi:UDP-N-acetylmuramate dehydrogenase
MSRISFLDFEKNKRLSDISTFRIGGPAEYFIEIREIPRLLEALEFCKCESLPYHIVGKGSNTLFPDKGLRGLVILNKLDFIETNNEIFRVGAGYNFSLLGVQTARQGYAGLEFASGIPASVGGAVFMNAGANAAETKDYLYSVEYLHEDLSLKTYLKEDINFSYRHSSFQNMQGMILAATFKLRLDKEARENQLKIINYRKKTQPYHEPSVGCIFQNPNTCVDGACLSAGALIEKAGLKGMQVGGVKISEMHANFIVNTSGGKAEDVLALIAIVKEKVFNSFGVLLQEEVRLFDERKKTI